MSYIWDDYSVENTYYLAERDFSPYMECMNTQTAGREVNGLFRFDCVFDRLTEFWKEGVKEREEISILFHILANYDLLSGLTEMDICMILQEEMILTGYYGTGSRTLYERLNTHQKYTLLHYMEKRRRCGSRKTYAYEAASELLHGGLYYSCKSEYLLIFIPHEKREKSAEGSECTFEELYELWKSLFFDYWTEIEAVWKRHFGVIGFDSSMRMGEIQLI